MSRRPNGAEKIALNIVKQMGQRIRELRTLRRRGRMTQENLAERADISVSFLSMIERGERSPHIETLVKIARALEVEISDLFTFPGQKPGVLVEEDPAVRMLADFARRYALSRRDVERLLGVAKALFPR